MIGFENSMLRQVLSVPDLLDEVYPEIEPQVRYVLTTPEIYSIKKVVLTSCGDGYAPAWPPGGHLRVFFRFLLKWKTLSPCPGIIR